MSTKKIASAIAVSAVIFAGVYAVVGNVYAEPAASKSPAKTDASTEPCFAGRVTDYYSTKPNQPPKAGDTAAVAQKVDANKHEAQCFIYDIVLSEKTTLVDTLKNGRVTTYAGGEMHATRDIVRLAIGNYVDLFSHKKTTVDHPYGINSIATIGYSFGDGASVKARTALPPSLTDEDNYRCFPHSSIASKTIIYPTGVTEATEGSCVTRVCENDGEKVGNKIKLSQCTEVVCTGPNKSDCKTKTIGARNLSTASTPAKLCNSVDQSGCDKASCEANLKASGYTWTDGDGCKINAAKSAELACNNNAQACKTQEACKGHGAWVDGECVPSPYDAAAKRACAEGENVSAGCNCTLGQGADGVCSANLRKAPGSETQAEKDKAAAVTQKVLECEEAGGSAKDCYEKLTKSECGVVGSLKDGACAPTPESHNVECSNAFSSAKTYCGATNTEELTSCMKSKSYDDCVNLSAHMRPKDQSRLSQDDTNNDNSNRNNNLGCQGSNCGTLGGQSSCPQGTYPGTYNGQAACIQSQQANGAQQAQSAQQHPQQQQGTFGQQNPYQQQQQQQCPQGYQLTNGYCQPQQCQSGYQLVNGYCQPQQCQWDSVDNETATVWSDCASTQAIYDSRVATYNDNVLMKFNDNMNQWTSMRQQGQCSKKPSRPAAPQQCTSGSTGANDPKASISCHDPNNVPRASYEPGMPFTIEHTCTNSTGSTGTNFSTNNQTSGSVQVTLSASSTLNTYAVTCTNGTKTASAQCSVNVQTPRIAFTATPSLITKEMIANKQATSTIGWVTSAMASCRIMNMGDTKFNEDNSSNTSVNGAVDYVVTKTTTFTLTCTSVSGKVKAANTVITVR